VKWPSLNKERTSDSVAYVIVYGTLDECIKEFISKPAAMQHLYEIHTKPQPPLVTEVMQAELIVEIARLQDFL
jgi:hypothetical protein